MLDIVLINAITIAVFYAIFGLPARRYRMRIEQAGLRLKDTSVEKGIAAQYQFIASSAKKSARRMYAGGVVAVLAVLTVGFGLYARLVESEADLLSWLTVYALFFGVAFVACIFILASLVATAYQITKLHTYLSMKSEEYPNSTIVAEAHELIYPRFSEGGIPLLSALAVTAGVLLGSVYIVVLFLSAQTAIECARSSKCL